MYVSMIGKYVWKYGWKVWFEIACEQGCRAETLIGDIQVRKGKTEWCVSMVVEVKLLLILLQKLKDKVLKKTCN